MITMITMITLRNKSIFLLLLLVISACDNSQEQHAIVDFKVEHCNLTYQGEPLTFGASIDQWVAVMGPFDHWHELVNDVYVWDKLGVTLYAEPGTYKARSFNFEFDNSLPFSEQDIQAAKPLGTDDFKRQINAAKPKLNYASTVWVNGAQIRRLWDLAAAQTEMFQYNPKTTSVFEQGYTATHFVTYIRCPLDKYPRYKNKEMLFIVNIDADDSEKTERLSISIKLVE